MSVQKDHRWGGWITRYRDEHGKQRTRKFELKADADAFDRKIKEANARGDLDLLNAGLLTLAEYHDGAWSDHLVTLAPKTRTVYEQSYALHVEPRLGDVQLQRLRVERVRKFQSDLIRAEVKPSAIDKAMRVLSAILGRAEADERIAVNPMHKVKVSRPKPRPVRPLPPATIEALRARLAARTRADHPQASRTPLAARDAIVVSILAYAGLRPHELRGLRWRDITSTLHVNAGKTGERVVRLLAPLAADLAEWRLACGRPADFEFVVPSERETEQAEHIGQWTANGFEGWRQRVFVPNMQALGLDVTRAYDLRHALASLLAHEGRSVVYIAKQLGHSATVSLAVYQHVIDEFEDRPALAAEDAIREAREERKALRRQS